MGIQGSGKSTLAKRLQKEHTFIHISTGDVLRRHIDQETPLGLEYQKAYEKGIMASDEIMYGMLDDILDGYIDETIVLDGFPRNIEQLEWFASKYSVEKCIHVEVPKSVAQDRMIQRGRADDNPEAILTRFESFESKTMQVINFYEEYKKVVRVNNNRSIDSAFKDLTEALGLSTRKNTRLNEIDTEQWDDVQIHKLNICKNDVLIVRIPSDSSIQRGELEKTLRNLQAVINKNTGVVIPICMLPGEADLSVLSIEQIEKAELKKKDD